MSDRFLWESTIVMLVDLAHGLSSWSSSESSEWNDRSVIKNSLHIVECFQDVETSACSSSLISVFKMNSLIVRSALSSYRIKTEIRTNSYDKKMKKFTSRTETCTKNKFRYFENE